MVEQFNPSVTQRVLLKAKADGIVAKQTFLQAHKGSFVMWYSYFIGLCVAIQTEWPNIAGYVPVKVRWIMGVVTILVAADKLRRSKPVTE